MSNPLVAISTDFLTAFAELPRQKQGKVTEFFNKFRNNPLSPGIHYEKIEEGIDDNICSVRIDDTYRGIIVRHAESGVYMLLWVDHHDEAYAWAKRKKCSINKTTGSVQIFDVQEIAVEKQVVSNDGIFEQITNEQLAVIGVPEEQFEFVRRIQSLIDLYNQKSSIPEEAYEGLEWIGNGFEVEEVLKTLYPESEEAAVDENDFATALQNDVSQKRFVIVDGEEELKRIMAEPLEKWRIFLHPTQRKIVKKRYSGPARVWVEQEPVKLLLQCIGQNIASKIGKDEKILFTTFTKNLAEDIKENLRKICSSDEMKKIEVVNLDAWISGFLREQGYEYQIVFDSETDKAWEKAISYAATDLEYSIGFFEDEWVKVVQAQEAYTKETYLKASRLGRGVRLDRKKRMQIWEVFEEYQNVMNENQQRDVETAMYECRKLLENKYAGGQYVSIIVDEGQDFSQVHIVYCVLLRVQNMIMIFL